MPITLRPIEKRDNPIIADLIRTIFREFKIDMPGTVYTDPTTDDLYSLFQMSKSKYWIAEEDDLIVGGCGIFPTSGLPEGCVELVKYYVSSTHRGKGIGSKLIQRCIISAQELGYTQMYLESFPELSQAVTIYRKVGFEYLPHALGKSGHFACTIWMIKKIA